MKKLMFAVTLLAVVVWAPALQAAWIGNDVPIKTSDRAKSSPVEGLIIDGASGFLKSYSDILLLLNESEIGLKNGFNLSRSLQLLESAFDKLAGAKENYSMALDLMREAVFDEVWLKKLKIFDYTGLAAARNLQPKVMKKIASFLVKGDVPGVYRKLVTDMEDILDGLEKTQEKGRKGIFPEMEELRTIYRQYSDFMLFGYYTSLVFSEIKK